MASFPDVPTMAEAGIADMTILSWTGFLAPAGTPPDIVAKLEQEIMRIIRLPDIRARLQTVELEPVGSTAAEFSRIIAKDLATWQAVAKAANLKVE